MSRLLPLLLTAFALTACVGVGDGNDVLPVAGEWPSYPTILSATARCKFSNDDHAPEVWLEIAVDASDPEGDDNLDWCSVRRGATTFNSHFGVLGCAPAFPGSCTITGDFVVYLRVANKIGHVTEASVTLTLTE